jgi:hypothetical protein
MLFLAMITLLIMPSFKNVSTSLSVSCWFNIEMKLEHISSVGRYFIFAAIILH